MPIKTFLRVGAYYQANAKALPDDMEMTAIVSNADPNDPVIIGGGSDSSLVYVARLTHPVAGQPPVATVLKNTIGEVSWEYFHAGAYNLNGAPGSGLFPVGRTFIYPFGNWLDSGNPYIPILDTNSTPTPGTLKGYYTMGEIGDGDAVFMECVNETMESDLIELRDLIGDGSIFVKIEVFPEL